MKNEIKSKIIARAWKDEAFKEKLLKHPHEVLKEFGEDLDSNAKLTVLEESNSQFYFVLPTPPSQVKELNETELENIAAAGNCTRDKFNTCAPAG